MNIYIVDAFTSERFKGNPAAVCLQEEEISDSEKQLIAAEMNLSETAFVKKRSDGFDLTWFTPVSEVDLCGHATLASAHILLEENIVSDTDTVIFHTRYKGVLKCGFSGKNISLDFPLSFPSETEYEGLVSDLFKESRPAYIGLAGNHFLVELNSVSEVTSYKPDFVKISSLPKYGLIITSTSDDGYDFVSRFFAPAMGVNEDPVTGSAHCALGAYWSSKTGKRNLRAFQASQRGGTLELEVTEDRIFINGRAVTFMKGVIK